MESMLDIPFYMHHALQQSPHEEWNDEPPTDPFWGSPHQNTYVGPRAKWLLASALHSLNLNFDDEIAIITTSQDTYVSTCVSVTAFNFAAINRIVTNKTKVVIVIYEFGYLDNTIVERINQWRASGITVIEDCAHIIGERICGRSVGSFGDFALYSLPKVLPAIAGGMLRTNYTVKLPTLTSDELDKTAHCRKAIEYYLPRFAWFNRKRKNLFALFSKKTFQNFTLHPACTEAIPTYIGFLSQSKKQIESAAPGIEWGATLRGDLLYLPNNPLIPHHFYIKAIRLLLNLHNYK